MLYFKRHSTRLLLTRCAARSLEKFSGRSFSGLRRKLILCSQKSVRVGAIVTSKMENLNAGHMMSLAALQRQDPYINKLLDVTGQVALYNFNSKTNEWVRLLTHPKQFHVTLMIARCSASMLMLAHQIQIFVTLKTALTIIIKSTVV